MLVSGSGMIALRSITENTHSHRENVSVEQQECDGENANLVRGENNDIQENNDAQRDQKDKSNEERNVRL